MTNFKVLTIAGCLLTTGLSGQIYLDNSSFEGTPQDATVPVGWHACAPGTTPDILPGPWGVFEEASEGETFLGLITRHDGTFESIGQRLKTTIKANECYQFALDLARSSTYTGYTGALKIRIWGGATKCQLEQMLVETPFIEHSDWQTYPVQFFARRSINYLVIEAFYDELGSPHRGNILIDNVTPLKRCDRAALYQY